MRNDCFDEGTIQAFLDGELASDLLENTARHLAICGDCAAHLATAEEEIAFAFSALEHEFNTLVPTQRLWTKINDSIEREKKSFWNAIFAFFKNPALASFAAFLIVFGIFVAYMNFSNNNSADIASSISKPAEKPAVVISTGPPEEIVSPIVNVPPTLSTDGNGAKNFKVVEAKFDSSQQRTSPAVNQKNASQPAVYEYLPGEESYIKTIATMEKTVDDRKDEVLKPSSRVAYEKDLALINDAIKKMQVEVRKNPKNETAKQILLDSYQNKVDLLNSVAGKTELMASLR